MKNINDFLNKRNTAPFPSRIAGKENNAIRADIPKEEEKATIRISFSLEMSIMIPTINMIVLVMYFCMTFLLSGKEQLFLYYISRLFWSIEKSVRNGQNQMGFKIQ